MKYMERKLLSFAVGLGMIGLAAGATAGPRPYRVRIFSEVEYQGVKYQPNLGSRLSDGTMIYSNVTPTGTYHIIGKPGSFRKWESFGAPLGTFPTKLHEDGHIAFAGGSGRTLGTLGPTGLKTYGIDPNLPNSYMSVSSLGPGGFLAGTYSYAFDSASPESRGFVAENGTMAFIRGQSVFPGYQDSAVVRANNAKQVVGGWASTGGAVVDPFLYENGSYLEGHQFIPGQTGIGLGPRDLNEKGSILFNGHFIRAIQLNGNRSWERVEVTSTSKLGFPMFNSSELIVGYSNANQFVLPREMHFWSEGQVYPMNEWLVNGQIDRVTTQGIYRVYDDGSILAGGDVNFTGYSNTGYDGQQYSGTFLLEPVPEPGTLAALGLGLAALMRRRRKS